MEILMTHTEAVDILKSFIGDCLMDVKRADDINQALYTLEDPTELLIDAASIWGIYMYKREGELMASSFTRKAGTMTPLTKIIDSIPGDGSRKEALVGLAKHSVSDWNGLDEEEKENLNWNVWISTWLENEGVELLSNTSEFFNPQSNFESPEIALSACVMSSSSEADNADRIWKVIRYQSEQGNTEFASKLVCLAFEN